MDISKISGKHFLELNSTHIDKTLGISAYSPYVYPCKFIKESYLYSCQLPNKIIEALYDFRNHSNDYGALLIRGFSVLPDHILTPKDNFSIPDTFNFYRERVISMIGEQLGYLVSYKQEKKGVIFQNIIPSKEHEYHLSSESSKSLLDFHTEIAFHYEKPDYIILLCIRPDHDKKAKTFTSSTRRIKSYLSNRDISILSEKKFKTGVDYSFGGSNGEKGNGRIVSVFKKNNHDYICYDLDLMEGIDSEANEVLKNLSKAANHSKCYVSLESGDLLIIDNNRAIHGRTRFTPRYDGFDRWLLRACVLEDRVKLESVSTEDNPRMICREF
ncbi:TauD/TfdA family dioxygenase [Erwinia piriflorinigrans]|uniref:Oxygenase (Secreted protein) n=1 Tax=Erwinia piriflorinigrans CFBP 5888 TaxID=1161919 RepID=V5Z419_9GAMM|nr:TauD/TfdA family dioxygenase [Erwinia piriflorinigrans]CCG86055.1 oxygenase (secreted protein) [Erwinia piriflorinigrans CFBP 5888]